MYPLFSSLILLQILQCFSTSPFKGIGTIIKFELEHLYLILMTESHFYLQLVIIYALGLLYQVCQTQAMASETK